MTDILRNGDVVKVCGIHHLRWILVHPLDVLRLGVDGRRDFVTMRAGESREVV